MKYAMSSNYDVICDIPYWRSLSRYENDVMTSNSKYGQNMYRNYVYMKQLSYFRVSGRCVLLLIHIKDSQMDN